MLEQKIASDYVQAMKDKDALKSSTLSLLRAQVKNVRIEKRAESVDDVDVIAVIKKQIKQRQESISQFEQGGRNDLAEKEKAEMAILQTYLPQQASAEEIGVAVKQIVQEIGAKSIKDMGSVMKAVVAKFEGRADNKIISDLVKQALSSL